MTHAEKGTGQEKKTLVNEFRGRSCSKIGTFEKHVVTLDQKNQPGKKRLPIAACACENRNASRNKILLKFMTWVTGGTREHVYCLETFLFSFTCSNRQVPKKQSCLNAHVEHFMTMTK